MKDTFNIILLVLLIYGVFGADEDEVKSLSVIEGGSVTLNPDLTQIQTVLLILWRFGNSVIAQMSDKKISYPNQNEISMDRLKLNQTGSLIIKNMRTKHSGLYELQISHSAGTSYRKFSVHVYESPYVLAGAEPEIKTESVKEGDPVTLHVPQLTGDELIVWRFGDEGKLIAKADIEAKSSSLYDKTDERFRDRLKLDQTGSLIIANTRTTDSGLYTVKISSNKQTSYKRFTVTVGGSNWMVIAVCIICSLVLVATVVIIYFCRTKQNKLLSEINEKLKQLPEISKQLQQLQEMPENIEQLPDICPGESHDEKVPGKKLSDISKQLEQLSNICEKELPEINEKLKQLHDKKISEQLLKISGRIRKRCMGKSPHPEIQNDHDRMAIHGRETLITQVHGGSSESIHGDGKVLLDKKTTRYVISVNTLEK